MNLRWLWFDYVDPQLNLTREQRREVRGMALNIMHGAPSAAAEVRRLRKQHRGIWAALLMPLVPAAVMGLVMVLRDLIPTNLGNVGLAAGLLVQLAISYLVIAALGRIAWKPAVTIALRRLGYDVCINCGYLLRGLPATVTHCPECGTRRDSPLIE